MEAVTNAEIKMIKPYCSKHDYQRFKNRVSARNYRSEKKAQRDAGTEAVN